MRSGDGHVAILQYITHTYLWFYYYILLGEIQHANGRLKTFEGSLLLKAAIERDMGGRLEEKCHYYQGCISSNKELIRMAQGNQD